MTEEEIHKIDALELSHWWYRGIREIVFALLTPYLAAAKPRRILDIGCGTGGNLLELARFGDARGIDLDPLCVEYCRRKGLQADLGSMLDIGAPAASLDLVTMFDVLTQVDPAEMDRALSGIADAVKPGGLLSFREPGMPIARGAHDRAVNIRQRLTTNDVRGLLSRAGFEPLRITYMNTLLFPPIVAFRRMQDALSPRHAASDVQATSGVLNGALLGVLRVEKALLKATDLPFGVSVFTVARRVVR